MTNINIGIGPKKPYRSSSSWNLIKRGQ